MKKEKFRGFEGLKDLTKGKLNPNLIPVLSKVFNEETWKDLKHVATKEDPLIPKRGRRG